MTERRETSGRAARHADDRDDAPVFETLAEAEARNLARIDSLADRQFAIAAALEACNANAFCCLLICAVCARRFRRAFMRELLGLERTYEGPHEFATIYIDVIPEGSLATFDLASAIARFRKRLRRSGFSGSLVAGGIEVAWLAGSREWLLHVHVLAINVDSKAWAALEEKLAKSGRSDPLRHNALRNPKRQLSYALKFVTYHRPGKGGPGGRARAFPLPRNQLSELAAFWSRYRFEDFVFLFGARRRGGRIVPEV